MSRRSATSSARSLPIALNARPSACTSDGPARRMGRSNFPVCSLRAEAARRVYDAAVAAPYFVAGSGRFDTAVMELLGGAALVKTGAEVRLSRNFREEFERRLGSG